MCVCVLLYNSSHVAVVVSCNFSFFKTISCTQKFLKSLERKHNYWREAIFKIATFLELHCERTLRKSSNFFFRKIPNANSKDV